MAYLDVKITDLAEISSIKNTDLFLVSHPLRDSTGALQQTPYTSNSICGGALSGAIKNALEGDDLSVSGKWTFHTSDNNLPTQDFRYAIGDFLNALKSDDLSSIVSDTNSSGWYYNLPTSFVQKADQRSGTEQSLSVTNNSIANIDVVQRMVAGAYQSLLNMIKNTFAGQSTSFVPSHVGQIIHSTTLNSESAVRAVYGDGQSRNGIKYPDTHWIQHSGYFLRGGTNVSAGKNNQSDANFKGGGEPSKSYNVPLKSHTHTIKNLSHSHGAGSMKVSTYGYKTLDVEYSTHAKVNSVNGTTSRSVSGSTGSALGGTYTTTAAGEASAKITVDHIPVYKNVYIWERIS